MKRILIIFISLIFIACNKNYRYIESVEEALTTQEKEETFTEKNDTLAFLRAYKNFLVSKKSKEDLKKHNVSNKIVKAFKLYNPNGQDISNISFVSREKAMVKIEKDVMSRPSTLDKIRNDFEKERVSKIDSSKVRELAPFFKEKKDEFEGYTWIEPKTKPKYRNQNGFYLCFIKTKEGYPTNLRFVGQYTADNWLFIQTVKFNIDGNIWDYNPNDIKRDNNIKIWEWFDDNVESSNASLIEAIAYAKNPIKVRFIGRQYYDERIISKKEIKSILETIQYYKALGGKY
nr:MAG TPA: hypothetical protein [Caudoviricetes sp.]